MKYLAALVLAVLLSACAGSQNEDDDASARAEQIVRGVYEGFAAGDMARATADFSPDIVWIEADNNPYADRNPYLGPDDVLSGLFARLGGEWEGFRAAPMEFVAEGGEVAVFGRYTGTYLATGRAMDAQFAHYWTISDGKIVGFQQYADTAQLVAVMQE